VQCEELTDMLAASADAGSAAPTVITDERARKHVEGCLRCQAELAQYRKLLRALHNLRTEVLTPAPGLIADVFAHLEEAGERHAVRSLVRGRRMAYAGGLAVAATAAGAGAAYVLVARRGRKLRQAS
jgi:hypothetical protein